jgi:hypothetical protein
MGISYNHLLQVVPQLVPGSSAVHHGPIARGPADAGSFVEMKDNAIIRVHSFPGGPTVERLGWRTDTNSRQRAFTVYAQSGGRWLGISVPALHGHLGWIVADPLNLVAHPALDEIHIALGARRLELLDLGRVQWSTSVVVGLPQSPTPAGHFSVDDVVRYHPPDPAYGIGALALSVAPATESWAYWRVAIHGLNDVGRLGSPGSEGCVHVPTAQLRQLLTLPVGTPVDIVS